eukprot:scaffold28078_cov57-Phaeocystis_antarctica.AAC.9
MTVGRSATLAQGELFAHLQPLELLWCVHRALGGLLAALKERVLPEREVLVPQGGRWFARVQELVQPRALRRRAPRRLLSREDLAVRVRLQKVGERLRGGGRRGVCSPPLARRRQQPRGLGWHRVASWSVGWRRWRRLRPHSLCPRRPWAFDASVGRRSSRRGGEGAGLITAKKGAVNQQKPIFGWFVVSVAAYPVCKDGPSESPGLSVRCHPDQRTQKKRTFLPEYEGWPRTPAPSTAIDRLCPQFTACGSPRRLERAPVWRGPAHLVT